MKKHTVKVDKVLINKLKPFWKELQELESDFLFKVRELERRMSEKISIQDIEFIMSDGYYCGIGNIGSMRLIHDTELR